MAPKESPAFKHMEMMETFGNINPDGSIVMRENGFQNRTRSINLNTAETSKNTLLALMPIARQTSKMVAMLNRTISVLVSTIAAMIHMITVINITITLHMDLCITDIIIMAGTTMFGPISENDEMSKMRKVKIGDGTHMVTIRFVKFNVLGLQFHDVY
jgi:hypothetical protein